MEECTSMDMKELTQAFEALRAQVDVRDRSYKGKQYPVCFVGTEATDILAAGKSRSEAVQVGRKLLGQGYFRHVLNEHQFEDQYLFYRFKDDEGKVHGEPARQEDGEVISWASRIFGSNSEHLDNMQSKSYIHLPNVTSAAASSKDHVVPAPLDEHNARLLDNVRPASWVDPKPDSRYNLVVIGAGTGGLVAAAGSAGVGAKVALIEEWMMGGDCLNVGCVPSKAIIRCAHAVHEVKKAAELGVLGVSSEDVRVDFGVVMARMRRLRADISHNDSAGRFASDLGVDVFQGRATFTGKNTVDVSGQTLQFSAAVIATGATAAVPPIKGLKGTPYLTSDSLWNLTQLPPRLAVIGAGSIGLECGQAFSRFGSAVTVLARTSVMGKEDRDAAAALISQMESEGIRFVDQCTIEEVTHSEGDGFKLKYMQKRVGGDAQAGLLEVDAVLVAAGKVPNVHNLGLEAAGVDFDRRRGVLVNDKLQTSNKSIFAVGDVCTEYHFTHVADFMARLVIRNALFFGSGKMSSLLIPWVTYTNPEVAHVGLYEADLQQRNVQFQTFKVDFKDVDRAILDGAGGFVKILTADKKDTILGATIVGPDAGNMISEVTVAMQAGMGLGSLASVIHPYPTQAESIRKCGDLYNKSRLTPLVKTIFDRFLAVRR